MMRTSDSRCCSPTSTSRAWWRSACRLAPVTVSAQPVRDNRRECGPVHRRPRGHLVQPGANCSVVFRIVYRMHSHRQPPSYLSEAVLAIRFPSLRTFISPSTVHSNAPLRHLASVKAIGLMRSGESSAGRRTSDPCPPAPFPSPRRVACGDCYDAGARGAKEGRGRDRSFLPPQREEGTDGGPWGGGAGALRQNT